MTTTRHPYRRVTAEAAITAAIAFVLSLPVLGPLLGRLDEGWGGGDLLSTYVNAYDWGWFRFLPTDQFGFPLGMNLNYFTVLDFTENSFALIVNTLTGGTFTGVNLLIVLSFPLVAALAYVVIRMTGLKGALAIALAVAFTFIPFHWGRALGHTYLATLYSAVIGMGLVLAIGSGTFSRLATAPKRKQRVWFWVIITVMVLVIAWTGTYYAAFTLILGAAALVWRFAHRATWRTLAREAIPLIGIVVATGIGGLGFILTARADPPLAQLAERLPYESVIFAGNLAMALLPLPQSQLPGLDFYNRSVVDAINAAPFGESTAITNHGTWITSLALLVFVGGLIVRARRSQPQLPAANTRVTITFIAYLTFVTILFFVPWGLNYLVAGTVTAQIRGWNRLIPLLLLLFILGAAAALARTKVASDLRFSVPIAVGILALSLLDAVLPFRGPYSDSVARGSEFSTAARDYNAQIQTQVPERCGVLQLPYMGYPEVGVIGGVNDYDHFWTSILNPDKRWSYGAVKFTDASIWASQLPQVPTDEQVTLLRGAGFCGIHLDTRAYITEQLIPLQEDLQSRFGAPIATALPKDGVPQWEFYDTRSVPAAPAQETEAFLHQPFIEIDYATTTPRDSLLQEAWWWTRDNVALIDLVSTSPEFPVTSVTGAIAAPTCGPVPVTVTLTAGDEQVMTTVLAKPESPAPFDLTLEEPTTGTATLTIDTPGAGCPEGDTGERRFAQVLNLEPR